MTGAAARLRAAEMRLAKRFGVAGSLVKRTATYNPTTLLTSYTEVAHPISALVLTRRRQFDPGAGRMVQLQEEQAVIPADALPAAVTPDADDQLSIAGSRYAITAIEQRGPSSTPRSFVCSVVRAAS